MRETQTRENSSEKEEVNKEKKERMKLEYSYFWLKTYYEATMIKIDK